MNFFLLSCNNIFTHKMSHKKISSLQNAFYKKTFFLLFIKKSLKKVFFFFFHYPPQKKFLLQKNFFLKKSFIMKIFFTYHNQKKKSSSPKHFFLNKNLLSDIMCHVLHVICHLSPNISRQNKSIKTFALLWTIPDKSQFSEK